jgi:hypothetical protein
MTALLGALRDRTPWTPAEDEGLRAAYSRGGIAAAMEALPGRSQLALYRRAQRLGVYRRTRWTQADDARLRKLWDGASPLREIARALGRSELTTYWRAQKLGLPLGCPAGHEYISNAARRTGYDTGQLRMILRWAGVEIRRALTRPGKRRGKPGAGRLTWYVATGDVDIAVEQWLETEPLESAARRAGMCAETLARRLAAIGITKPAKLGKRHWRVHPDDVERALGRAA